MTKLTDIGIPIGKVLLCIIIGIGGIYYMSIIDFSLPNRPSDITFEDLEALFIGAVSFFSILYAIHLISGQYEAICPYCHNETTISKVA